MNNQKSHRHTSFLGDRGSLLPSFLHVARAVRQGLITAWHLARLAIVYVRQSSPHQMLDHRESRELQYALVGLAEALGWPRDRILVFDEDQCRSAFRGSAHRFDYQRLIAEITMEHVGLLLGLELSRMARVSEDWIHLFRICPIFGVILADQDGVYDLNDFNDRLVLGMKGTLSEIEQFTMRNRLERAKLNKAQRGELIAAVPCGYVKLPTGEVALDPDEEVQAIVRLIFDKFDELGSFGRLYRYLVRNKIRVGARVQRGPRRGELVWRPATRSILSRMMHHPIYAGAYAYGRRRIDQKRTLASGGTVKIQSVPMSDWKVLLQGRLPAYITWEHYLANQERMLRNRSLPSTPGSPRAGLALLSGVLVCGACGRKMTPSYRSKSTVYYVCMRSKLDASNCCGLGARAIDELVAQQVLRALEPASLELSLRAVDEARRERERLHRHWKQRLERASYESQRAERQYQVADPENRLVVRTLEKHWEEALKDQRDLQEEYDRFVNQRPQQLSEDERARIVALSRDVPALWNAPTTTTADRKEIVRLLVERAVVHVRSDSEHGEVVISWRGGFTTRHEFDRPVSRYESLGRYDELVNRILELRQEGLTITQVAAQINREGYRTPRTQKGYTSTTVRKLLSRRGLVNRGCGSSPLRANEWWLPDLARHLDMPASKLREWAIRGWVRSRRVFARQLWIVWADHREQRRLKEVLAGRRRARDPKSHK